MANHGYFAGRICADEHGRDFFHASKSRIGTVIKRPGKPPGLFKIPNLFELSAELTPLLLRRLNRPRLPTSDHGEVPWPAQLRFP